MLESYKYVHNCLKWSLPSYTVQGKDKIVNTTVWRLKPFIDGNIVFLYKYVIKLHQNKGDI